MAKKKTKKKATTKKKAPAKKKGPEPVKRPETADDRRQKLGCAVRHFYDLQDARKTIANRTSKQVEHEVMLTEADPQRDPVANSELLARRDPEKHSGS